MKEVKRMCIVCRQMKDKCELNRIIKTNDNNLKLDNAKAINGRGAYICKDGDCFELLEKKKALNRAFKMNFSTNCMDSLKEEIVGNRKK